METALKNNIETIVNIVHEKITAANYKSFLAF